MQEFWDHAVAGAMGAFSFVTIALFALVSVLLIVFLRRTGLLRRTYPPHALLVSLYSLYIPAVFLFSGFNWSMIDSFEHAFSSAADMAQRSVVATSVEKTSRILEELNRKFPDNSPLLFKDVSLAVSRGLMEQYGEKPDLSVLPEYVRPVMAPLVPSLQIFFIQGLVACVEERILKEAAAAGLSLNILRRLWDTDIQPAMRGGLAGEVLKTQILAFFPPYYQNVRVLLVLALLPVGIEISLTFLVFALLRRYRAGRKDGK
ncbi:MAG: hypothetical protein LBO77_06905 [Desulfovibrio sp.]|nr:hypothetical protein [Desulfovibrio sp.]